MDVQWTSLLEVASALEGTWSAQDLLFQWLDCWCNEKVPLPEL